VEKRVLSFWFGPWFTSNSKFYCVHFLRTRIMIIFHVPRRISWVKRRIYSIKKNGNKEKSYDILISCLISLSPLVLVFLYGCVLQNSIDYTSSCVVENGSGSWSKKPIQISLFRTHMYIYLYMLNRCLCRLFQRKQEQCTTWDWQDWHFGHQI
jgi:hypothetical protein